MDKRIPVITLLGVFALVVACAVEWRNLSGKLFVRWQLPSNKHALKSNVEGRGNVCVIDGAYPPISTSACGEVDFHPHIYRAIGADEDRIIKWQEQNGFFSHGVDRNGYHLVQGYPVFSKLAWSLIEPVYLTGDELSALLEESNRISIASSDPVVRANLDRLSALALRAKRESKVLYIGY
jgi:hypothetical protein